MYALRVYDAEGEEHSVGSVKIGQSNMKKEQRRPDIPTAFDQLGEEFFSLGQDDSYYETLNELGPELRDRVLRALRDVALDQDQFQQALDEKVTGVSLLRSVPRATVQGQFSRLARSGARLSRYEFNYTAPKSGRAKSEPVKLSVVVQPESMPPTNVHVLIKVDLLKSLGGSDL